jgi:hypothetical protein
MEPLFLSETEVLERLNLSHDALVPIVFEGELKAYAPGAGSTALVIPKQSSKETQTCTAARKLSCQKNSFIDLSKYGKPDTEDGCYKALCDYYNFEKPKAIDLSEYSNDKASAPAMPQSASNPDDNIGCLSAFEGLLYPPHREYEYSIFYGSNGAILDRIPGLLTITINMNVHPSIRRLALSCLLPELRFITTDVEGVFNNLFPQAPAPASSPAPVKATAANFIRKDGKKFWHIGFEGKDKPINDSLGLQYIGLRNRASPYHTVNFIRLHQALRRTASWLTVRRSAKG